MKLIITFVTVLFSLQFSAQQVQNLKLKIFKIAQLSDSLKENSTLSFFSQQLYTLNDGGNSSDIFEINTQNGNLLKTISLPINNQDWEAMDFSASHLFIGDIGNNLGNRKDLKIYKIPISDTIIAKDSLETLTFYYPEQKDFTPRNLNNNYDAEAMIFHNGKLHIFTKEWADKSTTHYEINPNTTILQPAKKLEHYPTGFVVTDAACFQSRLYLLGYKKNTDAYLMVFEENESGLFFNSQPKKYYLGSTLWISQLEGIAVNEKGIYISGEAFHSPFGTKKQSFYFIPHNDF